mmetsp:Transcript_33984/g.89561  ORF Transcript_33984/g.89561 Transcript_33984/m.89561 type:complete len:105 (+) Transcript_33984:72-386(+)
MFESVGRAWTSLVNRVTPGDGPVNTSENQDLLNRINTGNFRAVPVTGGEQFGTADAGSAQPTVAQAASEAPPQVPDADQLRSQRLARFEQQPQQQQQQQQQQQR